MRATLRDGELTLVPRPLATVSGGPIGCLARAALPPDASVADLRFGVEDEPAEDLDEDEIEVEAEAEDEDDEEDAHSEDRAVEVRFIANDRPGARRALKRWAARTGHERIWFRDEVSELEAPAGIDDEYGTTCPSCGLEITDSGPDLMGFVHKVGHFPLNCFVCGTFVPQWRPRRRRGRFVSTATHQGVTEVRPLHVVGRRTDE